MRVFPGHFLGPCLQASACVVASGSRGGGPYVVEDDRPVVMGEFGDGLPCRDVCGNLDGVHDGPSVIADEIDGGTGPDGEIRVIGSVRPVSAGVEDHALAGSEPGGTVEARNGTLPQVGRVVGEEAASEIDSPLGCVEQLDPSCLLTVAVHHRRFVRNRHHLGDDEVRNVLGEGLEAQDNGCRRKK